MGVEALYLQVASFAAKRPSKTRLFDYLIHGITFSQISIDAGNAFLRKVRGLWRSNSPRVFPYYTGIRLQWHTPRPVRARVPRR